MGYAGLRKHLPLGYQFDQLNPQYFSQGSALNNLVPNPFTECSRGSAGANDGEGGTTSPACILRYWSINTANTDSDSTYHASAGKVEKRFKKQRRAAQARTRTQRAERI